LAARRARPSVPEKPYSGPATPRAGSQAPSGTVPPAPPSDDLVTITINGRQVQVSKGSSLLYACLDNGIPVPFFCDHRKLDPIGACRMCLVQIEKVPRLATSCTVACTDGLVVETESDSVLEARAGVIEFLLINHPLDCPVCDKGGECDLQDYSIYHGTGLSSFVEDKLKYPKPIPLSDRILLDMERCIKCERCVRFFDEITEDGQLVLLNRGVHTMIGTFSGRPLDSNFQGNIMEICPVGALTSSDWRFATRPWDMRSTPSVCPTCSVGCNISVQTRDDRLVRYMSRENPHVDDGWLCDRGRYGFHFVHQPGRILRPRIKTAGTGEPVEYEIAIQQVASKLQKVVQDHGAESVGAIASPEATNEELFLFQRWIREVIGSPHIDHRLMLDAPAMSPDDFALSIDDFDSCHAVFILGDEATLDLAPILELRLRKARRHHRTRLIPIHNRSVSEMLDEVSESETEIGIVAPESLHGDANRFAARLNETGRHARCLIVPTHANSRGAADLGCLPDQLSGYRPVVGRGGMGTWEMLEAAGTGRLSALIVMGPTLLSAMTDDPLVQRAMDRVELLVVLDILESGLSEAAHILFPLHTFAEKEGTYTNLEGRIQRLRQAIPPVASTPPDWRILQDLANGSQAGWNYRHPAEVMRDIVAAVPAYGIDRAGERARWSDRDVI
jgi:NADH-quinone oxidoreductase subunit G